MGSLEEAGKFAHPTKVPPLGMVWGRFDLVRAGKTHECSRYMDFMPIVFLNESSKPQICVYWCGHCDLNCC